MILLVIVFTVRETDRERERERERERVYIGRMFVDFAPRVSAM
jgi:hypothetical protein